MNAAELTRQDGARIRQLRRRRGMRTAALAEKVGLQHPQALRNIENEHRQASWEVLYLLADALGVQPARISRVPVPSPRLPAAAGRRLVA